VTDDELETRAQQIHADRHPAGTASVCGPCRDQAAGVRRRTLPDRLLYPANPDRVGYPLGALVITISVAVLITGSGPLWLSGWAVLAAMAWYLTGPPQSPTQTPQ